MEILDTESTVRKDSEQRLLRMIEEKCSSVKIEINKESRMRSNAI